MRLASRGLRDLDSGGEPININGQAVTPGGEPIIDVGEVAQIRRQAQAVYIKAFVSAAILTAIALLN